MDGQVRCSIVDQVQVESVLEIVQQRIQRTAVGFSKFKASGQLIAVSWLAV